MIKRLFLYSLLFGLFLVPGAFAIGVSDSSVNDTLTTISISSAVNLYAYEVNLDYSGTVAVPSSSNGFLGASTSFGSSKRNSILSVFESKLDSTQTGVSGSGSLFNVTHTSDLELRYALFIYADGTQEYVYYNNSGSSESSTSSGGGSSSTSNTTLGGAPNVTVEDTLLPEDLTITAEPEELAYTLISGQPATRYFNITNEGDRAVRLQASISNLNIEINPEFTLDAGESKIVALTINPIEKGLLTGLVRFSYRNTSVLEVPIVLNIKSENFLFDTALTISDSDRLISPGQSLLAQIDLKQVGENDKIDVTANYIIKDYSGNIYLQESETFFVLNEKSYTKTFSSVTLAPGKYVLGVEIVYPGAFATSSLQFEVKEPFSFSDSPSGIIVLIFLGILVVVLGIVFFTFIKRPSTFRVRRR